MFSWKNYLLSALVCLIVIAFSQVDAQAGTLNITNASASEIHAIYISDSATNDWEENILEGYYLPSGNEVDIQIPNYKSFDLRVEDASGNYEDYQGFPGNTKEIMLQGGGDSQYR
jgi:hypothetical protein